MECFSFLAGEKEGEGGQGGSLIGIGRGSVGEMFLEFGEQEESL